MKIKVLDKSRKKTIKVHFLDPIFDEAVSELEKITTKNPKKKEHRIGKFLISIGEAITKALEEI